MHINQQPDTYPENFRAHSLTVLDSWLGRRYGEKPKAVISILGHYTIV